MKISEKMNKQKEQLLTEAGEVQKRALKAYTLQDEALYQSETQQYNEIMDKVLKREDEIKMQKMQEYIIEIDKMMRKKKTEAFKATDYFVKEQIEKELKTLESDRRKISKDLQDYHDRIQKLPQLT